MNGRRTKEHIHDIPHDHAQSVREERREHARFVHARSVMLGGQALKMSGLLKVVFGRNGWQTLHRDHPSIVPMVLNAKLEC